jgi:hypothetical protein
MNKLEKSSILFIIFTFISSIVLLYCKYNLPFFMPILSTSILAILIILTIVIIIIID